MPTASRRECRTRDHLRPCNFQLKHGIDLYQSLASLPTLAPSTCWSSTRVGCSWRLHSDLLHNTLYEAAPWGITPEKAAALGLPDQVENCAKVYQELRAVAVWRVLVGGDYGFAWTPPWHQCSRPASLS